MASMSTNYHLTSDDRVKVEALWEDPSKGTHVSVVFGEHPHHLTVFFENWSHVADVANQMLGAATIGLQEG